MDQDECPNIQDLQTLWGNTVHLFSQLPKKRSSYRHEIVHLLCPGLSVRGQQCLTGIQAQSTLSRYISEEPEKERIVVERYQKIVKRDRSSTLVEQLATGIEEKYASAKSGDVTVSAFLHFCVRVFH